MGAPLALPRLHPRLERPALDLTLPGHRALIARTIRRHLHEPLSGGLLSLQPGVAFVVNLGAVVEIGEHGGLRGGGGPESVTGLLPRNCREIVCGYRDRMRNYFYFKQLFVGGTRIEPVPPPYLRRCLSHHVLLFRPSPELPPWAAYGIQYVIPGATGALL